jgi:GT2 family glycosyltransferase
LIQVLNFYLAEKLKVPTRGSRLMGVSKKVYIVILNWNGWRHTLECLESVFRSSYKNFHVIVCDNDSGDGSLKHIKEWADGKRLAPLSNDILAQYTLPPVTKPIQYSEYDHTTAEHGGEGQIEPPLVLIRTGSNLGFAGGNNVGLRYALARGDFSYAWMLNNDTVVVPESLRRLVDKAETDSRIGICGSLLCYYHNIQLVQAVGGVVFNYWHAQGKQVGQGLESDSPEIAKLAGGTLTYISGASMLVRMEFIREIGLMEEGYFLYFEEIDWAERAKNHWKMAIAADSVVYHKEGASIGTASLIVRSPMSQYYWTRNLIRFYALHRPILILVAILRVLREIFSCLLRGEFQLFSATCQALVHALSGRFNQRPRL